MQSTIEADKLCELIKSTIIERAIPANWKSDMIHAAK
jgi:hypothetical protein